MKKVRIIHFLFFFLLIVDSCNSKEDQEILYPPYTGREIVEIKNKVIFRFSDAYYPQDIKKELPFSIAQGALWFAVCDKNIFEIDRALYYGADINFYYNDIMATASTVLNIAIAGGYKSQDKEYFQIFKHLVSRGADIENIDSQNNSALMSAIYYRNKEVFDYLLERNVNINHRNIQNSNALMDAVEVGEIYYIKKLLELGIEVNVRITDSIDIRVLGWTSLDIAIAKGRQDIIDILRKYGAKTGAELDAEARK